MRPPRVSIATLIILVILFAVDCSILRHPFGGNDAAMLTLCTLPAANILVFGLYISILKSRRGQSTPFLFGFELFGWMVLFAFLYACNAFTGPISMVLGLVYFPVRNLCMDNLPFETMQSLDPTFAVAHKISTAMGLIIVSMVLAVLFSLIAVAGGWVCRHRSLARRGAH